MKESPRLQSLVESKLQELQRALHTVYREVLNDPVITLSKEDVAQLDAIIHDDAPSAGFDLEKAHDQYAELLSKMGSYMDATGISPQSPGYAEFEALLDHLDQIGSELWPDKYSETDDEDSDQKDD